MAALVIPHFWFGDCWPVDLVRITISFIKSSIRVPVAALRGRRLIVPCCQEKHFLKRKLRRWCDWWTCRRRRVLAGSLRRQNIAPAETWSITARPSKSAFFFFLVLTWKLIRIPISKLFFSAPATRRTRNGAATSTSTSTTTATTPAFEM